MTENQHIIQPPRIANWILGLFATVEDQTILGDLHEEFVSIVQKCGIAAARSWYRRQVLKSIVHLYGHGLRCSVWSTIVLVLAAYLFPRLAGPLPEKALFAVLRHFHLYQRDFRLYMFFATDGVAVLHVIMTLFIGCVVALLAKGREMVAVMTIALLSCSMFLFASVWLAGSRTPIAWAMFPWNIADWLAMLIGGAIVRTCRSVPLTEPAATAHTR